jgi:hypothetical protein
MLATTNDAFFGLDGVHLLPNLKYRAVYANAFDAGSEANNESCDYIPGPPCENPFMRSTEGAEGFVHVHSGIHGVGSLDAAQYDWRNPVVKIFIER